MEVRKTYQLDISLVIVTPDTVKSCDDLEENVYLVPRFYDHNTSQKDVQISLTADCQEGREIVKLGRAKYLPSFSNSAVTIDRPFGFEPTFLSFTSLGQEGVGKAVAVFLQRAPYRSVGVLYSILGGLYPAMAQQIQSLLLANGGNEAGYRVKTHPVDAKSDTATQIFGRLGCREGREIVRLGTEWNLLVLNTAVTIDRRSGQMPNLISFTPYGQEGISQPIINFLRRFGWYSVGIVYKTSGGNPYYSSLARSVQRMLAAEEGSGKGFRVTDYPVAASKAGIATNEYVFLMAEPFANPERFGVLDWKNDDEDDNIARRGVRSAFLITSSCAKDESSDRVSDEIKTLGITKYGAIYGQKEKTGPSALSAYIAMKALGQVIAEGVQNGWNISDGAALARRFHNRRFPFDGSWTFVDSTGSRTPHFCFKDFDFVTNKLQIAMEYDLVYLNVSSDSLVFASGYEIDWGTPGNLPPPNVPVCGYLGDSGPCQASFAGLSFQTLLTVVIPVFGALLLVLGITIWCWRRVTGAAVEWWRLDATYLTSTPGWRNAQMGGSHRTFATAGVTASRMKQMPHFAYKNVPVWIVTIQTEHRFSAGQAEREMLLKLKKISTRNVVELLGLIWTTESLTFVYEFMHRLDLLTVISSSHLDWEFVMLFAFDLVQGVKAIHESFLGHHGHLSPYSCLIDKYVVLKVSQSEIYELSKNFVSSRFERRHQVKNIEEWVAPEIQPYIPRCAHDWMLAKYANPRCDIYSVGSIFSWMIKDMLHFRKESPQNTSLVSLVGSCTNEVPVLRPEIGVIGTLFQEVTGKIEKSFVESLINKMEKYSRRLEDIVIERTVHLQKEQALSLMLLQEMLPRSIVRQLLSGQMIEPQLYPSTTIFFSIMVGFSEYVSMNSAIDVLHFLHDMFLAFDDCLVKFDAYKVETANDCYMVVSGLPHGNGDRHAYVICSLSLEVREAFARIARQTLMAVKMGIHSGPCAAGVVGSKRPRYCLFGDTVNVASRLALTATPSNIHVSEDTVEVVAVYQAYPFLPRGETDLKGLGARHTYWLAYR